MWFVNMVIKLVTDKPTILTTTHGVYAHAAILKVITEVNPVIGKQLHDMERGKQITMALVESHPDYAILRITLLADNELLLTNTLIKTLTEVSTLRIGSVEFQIGGVEPNYPGWGGVSTWAMFNTAAADRLHFRFVTPTAIMTENSTGQRMSLLYPEPAVVFRGLARRWEDLGGPALPDDLGLYLDSGACVISRHHLQTKESRIGHRTQVGFVGEVVYKCFPGSESHRQALTALSNFATYAGVGYQTARGMGAVQVNLKAGDVN